MLEQKGYYLLFDSASEEAMKEWAKQITPLDSIQIPSEIDLTLKSTKLFFEALQKKDNPYRITATGRFLMKTNFEVALKARKELVESISRNPGVLKVEIKRPIIIVGLPRTGTTFLAHLLSLDPDCRFFSMGEQFCPTPFPKEETYGKDWRTLFTDLMSFSSGFFDVDYIKNINELHRLKGSLIEEDQILWIQVQYYWLQHLLTGNGAYLKFLLEEGGNSVCAYRYLKRYLQHSSYQYPPRSHWVLKNPYHLYALEQMMTEFPDACVIFTHRHPASAMCSYFLNLHYMYNLYVPADHDIAEQLSHDCLQIIEDALHRFVGFRKKNKLHFNSTPIPSDFLI